MDIKAELRLIREKCPNEWEEITSECPNEHDCSLKDTFAYEDDVDGDGYLENCCEGEHCKECWDKAIEEEADGSNKRKENSKYCANNNNAK